MRLLNTKRPQLRAGAVRFPGSCHGLRHEQIESSSAEPPSAMYQIHGDRGLSPDPGNAPAPRALAVTSDNVCGASDGGPRRVPLHRPWQPERF
jgi:hypothetical protein